MHDIGIKYYLLLIIGYVNKTILIHEYYCVMDNRKNEHLLQ